MTISGNIENNYIFIRRIGDVAIADALNFSLNSVESIQRWGEEMRDLIDNLKGNKLVINLGSADYAPGPIMHTLASISQYANSHKIKLALCEIGDENKKAFKLTRLNTTMTITEGEKEAIKAVCARSRHGR